MTYLYLIVFVFTAKMPITNASLPQPKIRIENGVDVVLAEGTNLLATDFQMAAVEVTDSDPNTSLIVTGGDYYAEISQTFRLTGGKTTICGGTIKGGNNNSSPPPFGPAGIAGVLAVGGALQIAGGTIVGGDGEDGRGEAVRVRDTDATIAGGTLQGGHDNAYSLDIDSGANMHISGASFKGNWFYNGEPDVTVYGKKDLVLEGNNLKGRLCDNSPIDVDIMTYAGPYSGDKVVVINDCSCAPSVDECGGKSNKSSKAGKGGCSSLKQAAKAEAAAAMFSPATPAATTTSATSASIASPSSLPSSQPSSSNVFD